MGLSLTRIECLFILRVMLNQQRIKNIVCIVKMCSGKLVICKIFETLNVPIVIKVAWVKLGCIITDTLKRYQYKRCPRKCIEGYLAFEDIPLFPACVASSIFKPRWPRNKYFPYLYIDKNLICICDCILMSVYWCNARNDFAPHFVEYKFTLFWFYIWSPCTWTLT